MVGRSAAAPTLIVSRKAVRLRFRVLRVDRALGESGLTSFQRSREARPWGVPCSISSLSNALRRRVRPVATHVSFGFARQRYSLVRDLNGSFGEPPNSLAHGVDAHGLYLKLAAA